MDDLIHCTTSPGGHDADAERWHQLYEAVTSGELGELVPDLETVGRHWLDSVKHCVEMIADEEEEAPWTDRVYDIGRAWLYTGLVQTCVMAPQPPVDPAHLQAFHLQHYTQQVS